MAKSHRAMLWKNSEHIHQSIELDLRVYNQSPAEDTQYFKLALAKKRRIEGCSG
jgi:hypothetical protein